MEWRNYIRPIIAGLIALGLVILVIVFLVRVFSGGSDTPPETQKNLSDYANTAATATLVMQGPNVLNQNFRQLKISVGQNQNEMELLEGYEGRVIQSQTYQSNSSAYGTFLQSLQRQGFTNGTDSKEDYRGFCPFGSRYLYSFSGGSAESFTYWSTSCGSQGTFQGNGSNVRRLFINQVPSSDFSKFMNGTRITY